jgi:DNA-binding response OmpR family regulator
MKNMPSTPQPLPKLRILVIEDNVDLQNLYRINLKKWSVTGEVLVTSDGWEGILSLETEMPDMIIVDLLMPTFDGFKTISCINQQDTLDKPKVVVVTGLPEQEARVVGSLPGDVTVLGKPIQFDELERIATEVAKEKKMHSS